MPINKVVINDEVKLDLTEDTVTNSDVLSGVTFHDASGEPQEGALIVHNVVDNLQSTSVEDALSANQGRVLDKKFEYYERNGFLSRNLIPFPYHYNSRTINGVTFTVENGKVIANGTATGAIYFVLTHKSKGIKLKNNTYYRVSGCPSGNNYKISISAGTKINSAGSYVEVAYDYGNGANLIITKDYDGLEILIVIASGYTVNNVEFKPMLVEVASDGTYPTEYMPYSKSNIRLANEVDSIFNNGYASRNLIPYPYYNQSKTTNGITFTVNSDGTIHVQGTSTANAVFNLGLYGNIGTIPIQSGRTYRISGCPSGGASNKYKLGLYGATSSAPQVAVDYGNGAVYTSNGLYSELMVWIVVYSGQTVDFIFSPMLVEVNADGTYPTEYQKYIPSNEVLNEKIGTTLTSSTINASDVSYTFTDSAIKTDSMIDIYDTIYGFAPKSVTVTNGSCVITFDAQSTTHQIKLKIS